MKPSFPSNAGIFRKMGNPWISLREALKDFNRDPLVETPDMDALAIRHGLAPSDAFDAAIKRTEELKAKPHHIAKVKPKAVKGIASPSDRILNIQLAGKRRRAALVVKVDPPKR